jgi:hypothetical protein
VDAEAEQWLGCAMTYTLFECIKEKVPEILAEQTEEVVTSRVEKLSIEDQVILYLFFSLVINKLNFFNLIMKIHMY